MAGLVGVCPICCGEAGRRSVCRAALGTEAAVFAAFLRPWQFVLGVAGRVMVFPHATRAWRNTHAMDPHRVCLDFDESSAYSCARTQAMFFGMARWLRWVCPF